MHTISVVIPTVGRPALERAVRSALAQSSTPIEILVVADTLEPIELPDHPAVKLMRVGPSAGGNAARQAGIEAAAGELIALLDDDDEWLPDHLANQLRLLPKEAEQDHHWISCARLYARRSGGTSEVWPKRLKEPGETLPQYIFRKHSLFGGVGFIQASTLLFPRKLALEVPFDSDLRFHQDIAWLVDLSKHDVDIDVYQAPKPTVVYNIGALTVSKKITARQSISWASRLDPADKRTLGDFVVVHALQGAKNSGSPREMLSVIYAGLKQGSPGFCALAYGLLLTVQTATLGFRGHSR